MGGLRPVEQISPGVYYVFRTPALCAAKRLTGNQKLCYVCVDTTTHCGPQGMQWDMCQFHIDSERHLKKEHKGTLLYVPSCSFFRSQVGGFDPIFIIPDAKGVSSGRQPTT